MKKIYIKAAIAVLSVAVLSFVSCAKKEAKIIIGTGQGYEPFCYKDADGNLSGFDIEVVKEIDKRLSEYSFEFETFEFKNVLVSLASGKIDVGAHEFEENAERRKTYLYGDEGYNDYNGYLAVKADGKWAHITSLDDLAGNPDAVVAVSTGSNYEAFVKKWNAEHPKDKQLAFASYDDDYVRNTSISNGTNAAIIITQFDIDFFNTRIPGINLKRASAEPLIISKAYFLFKKDNTVLKEAFDGALREMKKDGVLDAIREKVFAEYFASFKER
ncbi:MAG: transporter substrate-binding domain-containing protein [Spirochaetaceae bacterium]|jgi:L-cystine transport system substrate-binding protein|nr:transporter substrate-binding domain-containing protein [Spirochaetaceae bacterium]